MDNRVCGIISNIDNTEKITGLTDRRDLSTLTFDCKYRVIDFPLSSIMNAGAETVYFALSQRSFQSVADHLGSGREWGFDGIRKRYFTFVTDSQDPFKEDIVYDNILDYLRKSKSTETVVMGANIIANIDLTPVIRFHRQEEAKITAVYKKVLPDKIYQNSKILATDEFENITDIHNEVTDSDETHSNLCLNTFVVNTEWLMARIETAKEKQEQLSLRHLILKSLLNEEKTVGYEFTGFFSNISDIQSYFQGNMDMLNYQKMRNLLFGRNRVFTKLKNEAPTYYCQDSNVKKSHFGAGCIIRGTVQNSLISRLVSIDLGAVVRNSLVMSSTKIGKNVDIQYAIIDKNVTIDDNVKISGTLNEPIIISKGTHITMDMDVKGRVIA